MYMKKSLPILGGIFYEEKRGRADMTARPIDIYAFSSAAISFAMGQLG